MLKKKDQNLRKTSIFVLGKARSEASSGVYMRVNEQRSEGRNAARDEKTKFCGSSEGFTLIELIVTLMIAGIFLTLAVPSFIAFIQNNRSAALANDLISAFHYARSEAVRRSGPVSVCASANASQTACGAVGDWGNGWLVFIDSNGDGTLAAASDRLKIHEALTTGTTVTAPSAAVVFSSEGFVTGGVGNFALALSGCTGNNARTVTVSTTGRISVARANC